MGLPFDLLYHLDNAEHLLVVDRTWLFLRYV